MNCKLCGEISIGPEHSITERHLKNVAYQDYGSNKTKLMGNRKGVIVGCNVQTSLEAFLDCVTPKIKISAKPNELVTFQFTIFNESRKDEIHVISVQIVHQILKFEINNHGLDGNQPLLLKPKAKLHQDITVKFKSPNIGQYETPIEFKFHKQVTNEQITVMREMIVFVENQKTEHEKIISPYACKDVMAKTLIRSSGLDHNKGLFQIPKNNKHIYLRDMKVDDECDEHIKDLADDIRHVLDTGVTKENYEKFFHHILWYEETKIRLNVKKYNMSGVTLRKQGAAYSFYVPGLAEKRPSLMVGDWMFIRPHKTEEVMYEAVIKEINDNVAVCHKLDQTFSNHYAPDARFDIRFFMSRIPLERMHVAIHNVTAIGLEPRIFPKEQKNIQYKQLKLEFFNILVADNLEQRVAVEHIVAGTSGSAPYLLHGPPGTGKTVTIVEAILQLVNKNPKNRIMVCTDSNMAADNVATMLIKYTHLLPYGKHLLRASSQYRVWETLPECLARYSNGTNQDNFEPVSIDDFKSYNIVITTLSHAAKFGRQLKSAGMSRHITHLFIDEAAQASEPACLIPVGALLDAAGKLVLAGDPHQLGPVVISHKASKIGLGKSLMERLMLDYPMYSLEKSNPNYVVMLRNNFRSNKEILDIPDKLFYKGQLRAFAKKDDLSEMDILGLKKHSNATVFHGVLSKEQKVGKSPSYFNIMECDIVKQYVVALVTKFKVTLAEIGIVTPYIRQVYTIKKMLRELKYDRIEVGTVEAFQGKEKRVIIISTVRANCNLLDHDSKFQLGFLVDDKRFNVAITRAKAKIIIIGNPLCLQKDIKWRMYMEKCRQLGTYLGFESEEIKHNEFEEILSKVKSLNIEIKTTNKN